MRISSTEKISKIEVTSKTNDQSLGVFLVQDNIYRDIVTGVGITTDGIDTYCADCGYVHTVMLWQK